jgi:hypothetical protein
MKILSLIFLFSLPGCTVVTNDRVFPKLVPYWSAEAKQQRNERQKPIPAPVKVNQSSAWPFPVKDTNPGYIDTNLVNKVYQAHGTNVLGIYLGMMALRGTGKDDSVQMFSATSGGMLRWISYEEFQAVYVLKTKPEYPN